MLSERVIVSSWVESTYRAPAMCAAGLRMAFTATDVFYTTYYFRVGRAALLPPE